MNQLHPPVIYPITSGQTTNSTTSESPEFRSVLDLVVASANAQIPLVQIREKQLSTRILFALTRQAVEAVSASGLKVLVNDRVDVALAAGAHGVHLTSQSLNTQTVRRLCGDEFVIGVSTHSLAEVTRARDEGASFAVFGPVFETDSKRGFGPPQGIARLAEAVEQVEGFPVLALGGIEVENVADCLRSGAAGIAGIKMFGEIEKLEEIVLRINAIGNRA